MVSLAFGALHDPIQKIGIDAACTGIRRFLIRSAMYA